MLAIAANSPIEVTQGAAMGTSIGAALLRTSANITFQPQQKPNLETEISIYYQTISHFTPMPMLGKRRLSIA